MPSLRPADLIAPLDKLPRFPLGHFPTPLEFLPRFTKALGGPQIYIKRDDCTGLAFGGNKTRHNEYLIGLALEQKAEIIVWGAGVQSNNCRQTAAACAKTGIDCHLVLGRGHKADGPDEVQGNLLLDHLLGAIVDIVDDEVGPALDVHIAAKAAEYRARGRRVFSWDRDTVKPLAAVSYILCLTEILEQSHRQDFAPDAVYVCSAGSTGAGLALGKAALGGKFPLRHFAPIEWPWDTQADMAKIANQGAKLLGLPVELARGDIDVSFDMIGPGYGHVSPGGLEAIALLARTEGILLDAIYSGKAMAGLIRDVRQGRYQASDKLVFIHTGGTPALFAYNDQLVRGIAARR